MKLRKRKPQNLYCQYGGQVSYFPEKDLLSKAGVPNRGACNPTRCRMEFPGLQQRQFVSLVRWNFRQRVPCVLSDESQVTISFIGSSNIDQIFPRDVGYRKDWEPLLNVCSRIEILTKVCSVPLWFRERNVRRKISGVKLPFPSLQ